MSDGTNEICFVFVKSLLLSIPVAFIVIGVVDLTAQFIGFIVKRQKLNKLKDYRLLLLLSILVYTFEVPTPLGSYMSLLYRC